MRLVFSLRCQQLKYIFLDNLFTHSKSHRPPSILGGDFNIDRFHVDPFEEQPFYDIIIDAGFTYAYSQNRSLENLCAVAGQAEKHCTVGVSNLDAGDAARCIGYIFVNKVKGVRESRVVFNIPMDSNQPTCPLMPVSSFQ